MTNGAQDKLYESLVKAPRLVPALFSVLVLGLFLLFLRELPEEMQTYLVPSVAIYGLGASLLGMLHRLVAYHYEVAGNNERTIPIRWRVILYAAHVLWFVSLIAYNFWRGVL